MMSDKTKEKILFVPFKVKTWHEDAGNRKAWRRIERPSRRKKLRNWGQNFKILGGFLVTIGLGCFLLFQLPNEQETSTPTTISSTTKTHATISLIKSSPQVESVSTTQSASVIETDADIQPATDDTDNTDDIYGLSEDDFNLLYQMVSQEFGNIESYISELYWVDNDFNTYEVPLDMGQQAITKTLINQMRKFGYDSIRETISDTVQWENYSEENTIDYSDERIINNIKVVLSGNDSLPNNLVYARCTEPDNPWEYTSDVAEAYSYMQSYYPNHEIDVYLFALNTNGSWWMACTDPTLEE